jgi:hypothetical protein
MSLTLLPPLQPPSPPRSSRRSPFSLQFLTLSTLSSIPSTPAFTPSPSQEWSQLHHTTPDTTPRSANSVSVYSTPLTAPQSPTTLPAWKAVPPTPPCLLPPLPSFPPACSPSYPPKTCFCHSFRDRRRGSTEAPILTGTRPAHCCRYESTLRIPNS